MRRLVAVIVVGYGLSTPSALADYTLVCQGSSGMRDVIVKGVGLFGEACGTVATNPSYSGYANCIDAQGQSGACPLGGAPKPKVKLAIVTRDERAKTNPQYLNLELGGKVRAYAYPSNCPDFKFDAAPVVYDLDPGDYTLCFTTPTKTSDPNNPNCIYAPVEGITVNPVSVYGDISYTGYYKCQ